MATPITHIFFADKFWNQHQEIDKFAFFAGNCLPDIRYIDKEIERTKFHSNNVSVNNVLAEKSDFWKGVKFHCFVDEKRDNFYEKNGVYMPEISDAIFIYSLKVLEDDILYSELPYRQDFVEFLWKYEFPVDDISKEPINRRKNVLCNYFSQQPCTQSRKDFILWIWLTEGLHSQIEGRLDNFRLKYSSKINDMIAFLENLM